MPANPYIPEASPREAAAAAGVTIGDAGDSSGGPLADPVLWIVLILAAALGLAQVGVRVELGVRGGR